MKRPVRVLVLTAAVALVSFGLPACARGKAPAAAGGGDRPARSSSTTATTTTTEPVPPLPVVTPYTPVSEEPGSPAKVVASRFVEAMTNYSADGTGGDVWAFLLASTPTPAAIAALVAPLRVPGADSVGQVVYPQMGGLLADRTSVMVVTRQTVRIGRAVSQTVRTIDVRVNRVGGVWKVVDVRSLGGDPPPPNTAVAGPVQQLLDNKQVEMPDSARWDLQAGRIDARMVDLLNSIGVQRRLAVTVFASGHPLEVFGTASSSNHTAGRAIDIWAVDGVPVFSQRNDPASPARAVVDAALAAGATEVGSPWDADGPKRASFANDLHRDHLHLAWDA